MSRLKLSKLGTGLLYSFSLLWGVAQNVMWTFTSYFGAIIGNTTTEQGILTSIRNVTGSIIFFWAFLADKYGRKFFMILGVCTMLFSSSMFVFWVRKPWQLLLIAFIEVLVGQAFYPAFNGFLGDLSEKSNRGSLLGKINSIGTFVAIAVLLFLGFYMDLLGDSVSELEKILIPFLASTSLFIFALVFLIAVLWQPATDSLDPSELFNFKDIQLRDILTTMYRDKYFIRFLLIAIIYQASMSGLWPLLPFVTLQVATGSPLGTWLTVSALWAIFNLPIAILNVIGGTLGDKFGRKPVIIISRFLLFTVPLAYLLALVHNDYFWLLVSGFLGGIAMGGAQVNVTALSIDLADHENPILKSSYNGALSFVLGFTAFFGALASGYITDFLIDSIKIPVLEVYIIMLGVITLARFIGWFAHFFLLIPPSHEKLEQTNTISST